MLAPQIFTVLLKAQVGSLFFFLLAALGLGCSMWVSGCGLWAHGARGLSSRMQHKGSWVVVLWLHCPAAHGIFLPPPGIEPMSSALEGKLLTTGPPGKSQGVFPDSSLLTETDFSLYHRLPPSIYQLAMLMVEYEASHTLGGAASVSVLNTHAIPHPWHKIGNAWHKIGTCLLLTLFNSIPLYSMPFSTVPPSPPLFLIFHTQGSSTLSIFTQNHGDGRLWASPYLQTDTKIPISKWNNGSKKEEGGLAYQRSSFCMPKPACFGMGAKVGRTNSVSSSHSIYYLYGASFPSILQWNKTYLWDAKGNEEGGRSVLEHGLCLWAGEI